ncbi:pentapeptide repeat-containing protein [Streptomyces erythrochromogenes]|uniref:pentapeptide repeat-containing protein n=1 Tax=Streptomyces erythrochromogenes TaxID=285574 RepID=UPI00068B1FC0|nr:pentapeptide repeat-containing protein [Streptomyces erythrochromogenes]
MTRLERAATLLAALSAIAVLGFTWKSITQVNSEQALARRGQIADRYTAAAENLGNRDSEDVRLGGVYALQLLMEDSPRDQATVIDVLSSFIRSHRKKPKPGTAETSLTSDITAALTVLASRNSRNDGTTRVDLREADLRQIRLIDGDLNNANLDLTDLRGAILSRAILYDATLGDADLRGAHLQLADLRGAILYGADLRGADLRSADLRDADLRDADLRDAKLDGADLSCTAISEEDLRGARGTPRETTPANCDFDWSRPYSRPTHHRR